MHAKRRGNRHLLSLSSSIEECMTSDRQDMARGGEMNERRNGKQ